MKAIHFLSKVVFLFLLIGCSPEIGPDNGYGIVGEWRLYERGGSPGYGYYTVPIAANPLQSLTFTSNSQIHKQGDEVELQFKNARYGRVESTQNGLALWTKNQKKDKDEFYYGMKLQGDTLILSPQCFEGCHFGFVKIR